MFLRLVVAPGVILSTFFLFASGVALLVVGPGGGVVLGLHKASFVVWFVAMAAHVLAHVARLPALATADWARPTRLPSAPVRLGLVTGALVLGTALAAGTLHLAQPWIEWARLAH